MNGDRGKSTHSPYRAVFERATQSAECHFAPAAERNTRPILEVLRDVVPETGRALEIASGTGQHVCAFAREFPGIAWQPSDPDVAARESIVAWSAEEGLDNILPPLEIDVAWAGWERDLASGFDIVICINMIHIAPWAACKGLLSGAANLLRPGGLLYLYGPYRREGRHTAPSNAQFDRSLRARNPDWGVRDLEAVERCAMGRGFSPTSVTEMPANNLSVVMRRGRVQP